MKTYLVAVDFSRSGVNAAEFTAALSHQTDVEHIVLLNAYYVSVYETILPNPDMVQVKEEEIEANAAGRIKNLEALKQRLLKLVRPGVEISTHLNRSHLLRAVVENAITKNADLVLMGSKGNSSRDEVKIGSHVIKVAKACPVPVVVVPTAYDFEGVNRVVVACDFSNVNDSVPLDALKNVLNRKKFELLVVNIDDKKKANSAVPEKAAAQTALYETLKEYSPQYFSIDQTNAVNSVLQFAAEKDAQLVIALPHRYSFLQSLIHNSMSQQLIESADVPILILK